MSTTSSDFMQPAVDNVASKHSFSYMFLYTNHAKINVQSQLQVCK